MRHQIRHFHLFIMLLFASTLLAQEVSDKKEIIPIRQSFTTSHSGTFGNRAVNFQAVAEETYLKNEKGESVASIWSVSYIEEKISDNSTRPVTFVFNGGPGSASVWLHMGMFGPVVVQVDSDASKDDGSAPFNLTPNKYGLLDLSDFVFIDPVGTGFSRVIGGGKVEDYWGLNEDAASIAQFIRLWVSKNKRWNSPKYIAGESFGTTRAAALVNELEESGQNMPVNGLILISQALDYEGSTSIHDNITSYFTYLPSMAATAWYHQKAGKEKSLEVFVDEARKFAYDQYLPALYRGDLLSNEEQIEIASQLSYFTGLDKDYILKSNNRILVPRFQKKLLEQEGLTVGRLDGRYMGDEADDVADRPTLGDPASYQISAAYTTALNHYLSSTLNVEMDRPYLTSNGQIGQKWNWRTVAQGQYWEPMPVNVARSLGNAMRRNTDMNVLVACGYYDLITPFFDAEYTFSRHGIVQDRVTLTYYEGGHMMYTHLPDFKKLSEDIRTFLTVSE